MVEHLGRGHDVLGLHEEVVVCAVEAQVRLVKGEKPLPCVPGVVQGEKEGDHVVRLGRAVEQVADGEVLAQLFALDLVELRRGDTAEGAEEPPLAPRDPALAHLLPQVHEAQLRGGAEVADDGVMRVVGGEGAHDAQGDAGHGEARDHAQWNALLHAPRVHCRRGVLVLLVVACAVWLEVRRLVLRGHHALVVARDAPHDGDAFRLVPHEVRVAAHQQGEI
mmetsp:Transcript_2586/g.7372  ORF Transcript_2586/g.7372 Transcript_2586/m.7372 type:complete len:221 (+) Transcript_2586:4464-5126(+)